MVRKSQIIASGRISVMRVFTKEGKKTWPLAHEYVTHLFPFQQYWTPGEYALLRNTPEFSGIYHVSYATSTLVFIRKKGRKGPNTCFSWVQCVARFRGERTVAESTARKSTRREISSAGRHYTHIHTSAVPSPRSILSHSFVSLKIKRRDLEHRPIPGFRHGSGNQGE